MSGAPDDRRLWPTTLGVDFGPTTWIVGRSSLSPTLVSRWRATAGVCSRTPSRPADLAAAQSALELLFPTAEEMDSGADNERTARGEHGTQRGRSSRSRARG